MTYLIAYLIFINLTSFIIYALDKFIALKQKDTSRISEKTLLLSALFGGILGSLIAMLAFRHKIKKFSFLVKFMLVFVIQITLLYFLSINSSLWNVPYKVDKFLIS